VEPERLLQVLGVTGVQFVPGKHALAVVDSPLATAPMDAGTAGQQDVEVKIDNFAFTPKTLSVSPGTTVTWTNQDDVPHNIVSTDKKFISTVLDTDQKFSFTFDTPGSFPYFCKIHPMMTGTVQVGRRAS